MAHSNLEGVLLAGGLSRRMGRDKAGLIFNGENLLLRARRVLLEAGCRQVFLSGAARPTWPDENVIADVIEHAGPAGALVSIVLHRWSARSVREPTDAALLLIVPVDLPLLRANVLIEMQTAQSGYDACHYRDAPLPVLLRPTENTQGVLLNMHALLKTGCSVSVNQVLQALKTHSIPIEKSKASQFTNVNTPEEWKGLDHESSHCSRFNTFSTE